MKKLLLIPITLTTLTPLISMVGCNNHESIQTFNLDQMSTFINFETYSYNVLTCEPVSLNMGSRYTVDIELSNGLPPNHVAKMCDAGFRIVMDLQQDAGEDEAIFDNAEVGVDDFKLIYYSPSSNKFGKNQFAIQQKELEGTRTYRLLIGPDTFTSTSSHVKIIFDIKEIEDTNYYPIFHIV